MSIPNLIKRVNALERKTPRKPGAKIALIVARAQQIAKRTNRPFERVVGRAIQDLGRPLSIADVDSLLSSG
jgi:hypothetical protein